MKNNFQEEHAIQCEFTIQRSTWMKSKWCCRFKYIVDKLLIIHERLLSKEKSKCKNKKKNLQKNEICIEEKI